MNTYLTNEFDLFFNEDPFFKLLSNKTSNMLKSDIKETDNEYIIDIEVAGIKKEDIKLSLKDQYLTVSVTLNKEENVKYLHSERYQGSFSRAYYVGNIKQENIKASFDNGLLVINIPKVSLKDEVSFIEIN